MEIVTIILGITIGFVLFGLGYLTASMMFMSKHTDEIDMLDSQVKENESIKLNKNKTRNDNNKNNKEGISDMR